MRLASINGSQVKQLKPAILAFCILFLLWKWGKGTYYGSGILRPDTFVLTHPATGASLPLTTIGYSVDAADKNVVSPPEKKGASQQYFSLSTNQQQQSASNIFLSAQISISDQPSEQGVINQEDRFLFSLLVHSNGKWVSDDRRPLYSGFGCKQWLSERWSCRLTQRTDFAYEKFKWQPEVCEVTEFEASQFLRRMQDKTIAYVGDSLGRQMFQSMMCMITGGEQRPDVEDVGAEYGFVLAPGAERPDGWAYRFPSTNTTILYHLSLTLCDLEPLNASDRATSYAMHLDRPPAFLKNNLHRFHVLILNTGHHWHPWNLRANKWEMYLGGAPDNITLPENPISSSDRNRIWKAKSFTIRRVVEWLDAQLPRHPQLKVFYRSISPQHFFNGDWNTGGRCDGTNPLARGSGTHLNHSEDADAEDAVRGTRIKVLDITALSDLREEGHLSRYSIKRTQGVQDCLHWCLPGVPDTWNEILAPQL